jgi:TPR repeat protein
METVKDKNTVTTEELYELVMSKLNLLDGTEAENKEALGLLEKAARMGYEPAIKELADIYFAENESD